MMVEGVKRKLKTKRVKLILRKRDWQKERGTKVVGSSGGDLVGESCAGFLPLALCAPCIFLIHAVYFATLASFSANTFGGRGPVNATKPIARLENGSA